MNVLKNTKAYLIGPMQYQDGQAWREDFSLFLNGLGVISLDPYKKPFLNAPDEDSETHAKMATLMNNGDYDDVAHFFKQIRSLDLSMVDRSDFIVCYLNPKTPTFGTMEELSWAVRMKRPIFIIMEGGKSKTPLWVMGMLPHKYIYDSFDDVKKVLTNIDSGVKPIDSNRWRLFKPELR